MLLLLGHMPGILSGQGDVLTGVVASSSRDQGLFARVAGVMVHHAVATKRGLPQTHRFADADVVHR